MRKSVLFVFVLLAASCGGDGSPATAPQAELVGADGRVLVEIEVADTREERARGLMGRESLADDAGMVFLYPEEAEHGAYWMKDTLIPLSIAFFDEEGTIVRILEMEPCRADPCPLYDPEAAYKGALEVNWGAFARWRIAEGDRVRLRL